MKLYICYLLSVNLQPFLLRNLKVHDTCGVHNLHGMPGVLAGIVGALMAGIASESQYGPSLYQQFPARAPTGNNSHIYDSSGLTFFIPGDGRSAGEQAGYQLLAVGVTLLIAIAGGLITGMWHHWQILIMQTEAFLINVKERNQDRKNGYLYMIELFSMPTNGCPASRVSLNKQCWNNDHMLCSLISIYSCWFMSYYLLLGATLLKFLCATYPAQLIIPNFSTLII